MTPPPKDAPAFDFYPERWLAGVAALSDAEQLAFLRLLCHQWLSGDNGLDDSLPTLKRLAGRGVTVALLAKFPVGVDGRRRNTKLETLRAEQRARIQKAKEKSEKMHAARYRKQRSSTAVSSAPSSACSSPQALHKHCPPPTFHHNTEVPDRPKVAANTSGSGGGSFPSLDEVLACGESLMAGIDCGTKFYNEMEACGWVNKHGNPLRDWRPIFRNYVTQWKANDHRTRGAGPTPPPRRPCDTSDVTGAHMKEL